MEAYLEEFLRVKIDPYRTAMEAMPLEFRVEIANDISDTFIANVAASTNRGEITLPATLDDRLRLIYALTAQLGFDLGRLFIERSGLYVKIGEDYATVYSEVMALFGKDKRQAKVKILDLLKVEIGKDRLLRLAGVGPQHISTLWN